jgi:hypothetical protein
VVEALGERGTKRELNWTVKRDADLGRYHDENTKEEDLIHPEDIEHFRRHDEMEDEAERVAALDKLAIVEQNIPAKFRRER